MGAGGKFPWDLVTTAALAAAVIVVAPGFGVAEQPSIVVPNHTRGAAVSHAAAPARGTLRTSRPPQGTARVTELPGEPLREVRSGRPASGVVQRNDEGTARETSQVDVALQPTWDRGFWVLPPGGLTRYLLLPPEVIDVKEVVAWLPRSP